MTVTYAGARSAASSRVQPSSFIAAPEPDTIPPVGVTPATRTPADRVTGSSSESKFIATSARASGLTSPVSAESTVARAALISTSPRFVAAGRRVG